MTAILIHLESRSLSGVPSSKAACIFDAIYLGLQKGSRCNEYCRVNPTSQSDQFCKVLMSAYTCNFAGYLIALINSDLYFLSESSHSVSTANDLIKATYLRVCFRFDKLCTGNIQERTFRRFPADISSFFPLLAALHTLDRYTYCDINTLTPIFCYWRMKVVTFINESVVTKNLREATLQAYPYPNHFYDLHIKYFRTHSVRFIACLILVVAKLSDATIEHRIR